MSYIASGEKYLRSPEDRERNDDATEEGGEDAKPLPKCPCKILDKYDGKVCTFGGNSPIGDFGHIVVVRHLADGKFKMLHNPQPDGTNLDGKEAFEWCIFFL